MNAKLPGSGFGSFDCTIRLGKGGEEPRCGHSSSQSSPLLPVPPPLTSFLPPQLHQADRYRVNKYVSVCSSKLRPSEKFLTKTWHPSLPFLQNTPLRKALLMICTPKSSKFLFVEIIEKRTGTKTHRKSNLLSNWLGTVFIFFSKIDLNRSVSN